MSSRMMSMVAVVAALASSAAWGTVLFEDDFSSQEESNKAWVEQFGDAGFTVSGGVCKATNESEYFDVIKHSDSLSEFTYSAKVKSLTEDNNFLGIVFCWGRVGGSIQGYVYSFQQGQAVGISRFNGKQLEYLYHSDYSYVENDENVLTVSKKGAVMNFFCNGAFVTSIEDSSYVSGEIGLLVGGKHEAEFDNVTVTDAYQEGERPRYFEDDFAGSGLTGWSRLLVSGEASTGEGLLTVAAGDSQQAIVYTEGNCTNAPVKVRARYEAGDSTKYYGIVLMEIVRNDSGGVSFEKQSAFVISSDRYYGVYSSGFYVPEKTSRINGGGGWDTLEVTSDLYFLCNGDTLTKYEEEVFAYNAVGLQSDPGVTAQFDDFSCGDSAYASAIVADRRPARRHPVLRTPDRAGTVLMVNPLGRTLGRGRIPSASSGYYLIRPGGVGGQAVRGILRVRR